MNQAEPTSLAPSYWRSGRWIPIACFVVVMAIACVFLARWQVQRLETKRAANAVVTANEAREPQSITGIEAAADAGEPIDWKPVEVVGRYTADADRLVRQRQLQGQNGYYVMTPFTTADGAVVWMGRGWIPPGADARSASTVPAPPAGEVIVSGWARTLESAKDEAGLPPGQIQQISATALSIDDEDAQFWVQVGEEAPAAATSIDRLPPPKISEGPHLGYAIQWGLFSVMALIGGVVIVRRQREYFAEDVLAAQQTVGDRTSSQE